MILGGGLVDQLGGLELGDIVIDLNNIPVQSAEDLGALVALAEKNLHFLSSHNVLTFPFRLQPGGTWGKKH